MKNYKILNWLAVAGWLVIIFWLSSFGNFSSVIGTEKRSDVVSSLVHVILYFILAYLLARAFSVGKISHVKIFIYSLVITALYAASDEWHQYYVPGREASIMDWGFDVLGSLSALGIFFYNKKEKSIS